MIQLGNKTVDMYPSAGIYISNNGGTIEFQGTADIETDSRILVGKNGYIRFGEKFCATAKFKCCCDSQITFGKQVLIGWEVTCLDTDFHYLSDRMGNHIGEKTLPISIGDQCWISSKINIMKGTVLPSRCVVATGSLLNKAYDIPEYSLIGGVPAKLKKENVWRNPQND